MMERSVLLVAVACFVALLLSSARADDNSTNTGSGSGAGGAQDPSVRADQVSANNPPPAATNTSTGTNSTSTGGGTATNTKSGTSPVGGQFFACNGTDIDKQLGDYVAKLPPGGAGVNCLSDSDVAAGTQYIGVTGCTYNNETKYNPVICVCTGVSVNSTISGAAQATTSTVPTGADGKTAAGNTSAGFYPVILLQSTCLKAGSTCVCNIGAGVTLLPGGSVASGVTPPSGATGGASLSMWTALFMLAGVLDRMGVMECFRRYV